MTTPLKIVVVDDSPGECRLWKELLEERYRERIVVETYTDPQTAIGRFRSDISFLLLDWQMPKLNGSDLLMQARERGIHPSKVVVMSQQPIDKLHSAFHLGDCLAVIEKGEEKQQSVLLEVLDEIVRKKSF